jgi:hypothetical protein
MRERGRGRGIPRTPRGTTTPFSSPLETDRPQWYSYSSSPTGRPHCSRILFQPQHDLVYGRVCEPREVGIVYCPRVVELRRFSKPGDGRPIVRQRGVRFLVEASQIERTSTTRTTNTTEIAPPLSLGARVIQVRRPFRTMLESEITGEREWWEGKGEKGWVRGVILRGRWRPTKGGRKRGHGHGYDGALGRDRR